MRSLFAAVVLIAGAASVCAQDTNVPYFVFPVKGIMGLTNSDNAGKPADKNYGGMIDLKYVEKFFPGTESENFQNQLNAVFQTEIVRNFPKSAISAKQVAAVRNNTHQYLPNAQCGDSTFTADNNETYAVSMGINRLSLYVNVWDKYVDVFVPVTYSLRFIQMGSGELAYTISETFYTRAEGFAADYLDRNASSVNNYVINNAGIQKIKDSVREDAKKAIAYLVDKASKNFKPQKKTIKVIAREGKYILFNGGSELGFASGPSFTAVNDKQQELAYDIVYTTKGLAVGVASNYGSESIRMSNSVGVGDNLSFVFTQRGKDDAKPDVLVNQYLASYMPNNKLSDEQVLNNSLAAILVDNIGMDAPFNVVTHDPELFKLINQIKSEANCDSTIYEKIPLFSGNSDNPKPVPDFFLKLTTHISPEYVNWGVGKVNSLTTFNTSVNLSILDRSGVVKQSILTNEVLSVSKSYGKGLSSEESKQVSLKNVTTSAAVNLIKQFKYKTSFVKVKSINQGVANLSETLTQDGFEDIQVVRPLNYKGNTIYIPVPGTEIKLIRPAQDTDKIEFKGKLTTNELIQVPSIDHSRKAISAKCTDKNGIVLQHKSAIPSGGEAAIASSSLFGVKGYKLLEPDPTFLAAVKSTLIDGKFEQSEIFGPHSSSACFLPMEYQGVTVTSCAAGKCSGNATVSSGIRVFDKDVKVLESIETRKIDFSDKEEESLNKFISLSAYENHVQKYLNHQNKLFPKD